MEHSHSQEEELPIKKWSVLKKIVIAGATIASTLVTVPLLLIFSALAFPFGVYFVGYACANKLMAFILTSPQLPPAPQAQPEKEEEKPEEDKEAEQVKDEEEKDQVKEREIDVEEKSAEAEEDEEKKNIQGEEGKSKKGKSKKSAKKATG